MEEMKRVVVTGATGMIGRPLCKRLLERGYDLTVFSRNPEAAREKVPGASEYIGWQPEESGAWAWSASSNRYCWRIRLWRRILAGRA